MEVTRQAHRRLVQVWAFDPKGGMELGAGERLFARFACEDYKAMADMLDEALATARRRAARLRGHTRRHIPTVDERPARRSSGNTVHGGETTTETLLTIEDVAAFLRVEKGTLYQWCSRRKGPRAFKVSRHLRHDMADVRAWLETQGAGHGR